MKANKAQKPQPSIIIGEKIDFCNFEKFASAVRKGEYAAMTALSLSFLDLHQIPSWVWKLKNLKVLNLRGNNISFIQGEPMENLEELILALNDFTEVPIDWLNSCPKLKTVVMINNRFNGEINFENLREDIDISTSTYNPSEVGMPQSHSIGNSTLPILD